MTSTKFRNMTVLFVINVTNENSKTVLPSSFEVLKNVYIMNYIPMNFLRNRIIFNSRDKLSPVYHMASSGLKKM